MIPSLKGMSVWIRSSPPGSPSPESTRLAAAWRKRYPTAASLLSRSVRPESGATDRTVRLVLPWHKRIGVLRIRNGKVMTYQGAALEGKNFRSPLSPDPEIPDLARRPVMQCFYHRVPDNFWARRAGKDAIPDRSYVHDMVVWYRHVCDEEAARGRPIPDVDMVLSLQDRMAHPSRGRSAIPNFPPEVADRQLRPADDPPGAPVFSQQIAEGFDDVPIPVADDISRVLRRSFPTTCYDHYFPLSEPGWKTVPWAERDPRALFRGNSTGCGTRPQSNPRLRLMTLAHQGDPSDALFDAGISGKTSLVKRFYWRGRREPQQKPFPAAWSKGRVEFVDHGKYRVLLDVDGNVIAYRLASLFAFGSAVVRFLPAFDPWFGDLLVSGAVGDRSTEGPFPNYYRVDRPDELIPLLQRLATPAGSVEAERVGAAGREMFLENLGETGMRTYTAGLLRATAALPRAV